MPRTPTAVRARNPRADGSEADEIEGWGMNRAEQPDRPESSGPWTMDHAQSRDD